MMLALMLTLLLEGAIALALILTLLLEGAIAHVEECLCLEVYKPVCSTQGNTYKNMCFLRCKRDQLGKFQLKWKGKTRVKTGTNRPSLGAAAILGTTRLS